MICIHILTSKKFPIPYSSSRISLHIPYNLSLEPLIFGILQRCSRRRLWGGACRVGLILHFHLYHMFSLKTWFYISCYSPPDHHFSDQNLRCNLRKLHRLNQNFQMRRIPKHCPLQRAGCKGPRPVWAAGLWTGFLLLLHGLFVDPPSRQVRASSISLLLSFFFYFIMDFLDSSSEFLFDNTLWCNLSLHYWVIQNFWNQNSLFWV